MPTQTSLSCSLAACDNTSFTPSSGAVPAKRSGLGPVLNSLATQRDRTLGSTSVPLLVSVQPVLTGGLPVSDQHWARGTRT